MPVILHRGPSAPLLPFDERVRRSRMEGCLVVVPTRRRVRHLTREIMRLSPGAVAPALPLYTMETLCRTLYGALPGAKPVVTGPSRTILFHRALSSAAGVLRYFATRGGDAGLPPGTFDRLIEVITGLKESGIYPDALTAELPLSGPGEEPKLADVAAIYEAYERELALIGVEDTEGIYRVLSRDVPPDVCTASFRRLFPSVETVSIAGFDEFSLPELGIIRRICGTPGLSVTMMFDYRKGNRPLFGHLEENYRLLTELGFREVRGESEAAAAAFFFGFSARPETARRAADHLAGKLFSAEPRTPRADLRVEVSVMAARSRTHEVECMCKLIRRLVAERPGRDLSGICIALRTPGLYTDIMRELFAEYEIPVNITDRFELARSPLVVTILGLLRIPLRGFQREDVLRIAGSPYLAVPGRGAPFDPGNLTAAALSVRATAGLNAWRGKLDRAAIDAEKLRQDSPGEAGERRAEGAAAALRKAKADLESLAALLLPLEAEMTAEEFERELLRLIEHASVLSRLLDPRLRAADGLMEKDVRAYNAFCRTLHEVAVMARVQDGPGVRRPLRVHYDRLKTAIGQERYNLRERVGHGVLVTSIEETRELPVEVMIVGGLVDGEFPSVYQPEIFLSARRRQERERRYVWENRYLFYQAVTNWTERLYLIYPLRDGEKEVVRSSFVDAFLKSSEVTHWESPEAIPFAGDIASRTEYLRELSMRDEHAPPSGIIPEELEVEWKRVRWARDVERTRSSGAGLDEYCGIIGDSLGEQGTRDLEGYRSRVYSISQLETYAGCPFRFMSRHLLRLQEREEFEEGMTPRERGALLHDTLFEFYTSRRRAGAPPLKGASREEFDSALRELREIAARKLESPDPPDVFWEIEKALLLEEGGEGLLGRFLEHEQAREDAMEPAYFEVSFGGAHGGSRGIDADLSREEPVMFGGVKLRGRIDRVEAGDGFFAVLDYKTGGDLPALGEIREGMSLQLPAYIHAAGELLAGAGRGDLRPAGGFYYRLRDTVELRGALMAEEFRGRAFPAGSRSRQIVGGSGDLREVIDASARNAAGILDGIGGGKFPLTRPDLVPKLCGRCGFRTICRIQSLQHVTPAEEETS